MHETIIYASRKGGRAATNDSPTIKVMGVGAAGTNIIGALFNHNLHAELISINTDWTQLSAQRADKKLLIGVNETKGLGCGGDVHKGRQAVLESLDEVKQLVEGTDLLFLIGGLGNGTATGAMPVIAEQAKKRGCVVVAISIVPFFINRADIDKTQHALDQLEVSASTTIVLDQNRLLEVYKELPLTESFVMMNTLVANAIDAVISMIRESEVLEVNFSHLKETLSHGGYGTLGVYEVETYGELDRLVENAVSHQLFHIEPKDARSAIVQVIGDPELSLANINEVASKLKGFTDPDAEVLVGAKTRKFHEGRVKAVVLLTGLEPGKLSLKNEVNDLTHKMR